MRLTDIEAQLDRRGIPFRRWLDWDDAANGWKFEVNGEIVATGAAIGPLEWAVQRWWNESALAEQP